MNSNIEIKVLITDNDQTIRDGLSGLLNSQDGLRVVATAENGQEVFAQPQAHLVDLMLLDMDIPVMSGIETACKLEPEYLDITIVMLIIFGHVEPLGQVLSAGIRGFLTKDTPAAEIAELIRKARSGQQVMGTRPIRVLTENYAQTRQDCEQYHDFITAVDNLLEHLRPTFRLLLRASANKSITRKSRLKDSTVRSHVSNILERTGCVARGELAITAVKAGIRE